MTKQGYGPYIVTKFQKLYFGSLDIHMPSVHSEPTQNFSSFLYTLTSVALKVFKTVLNK